jgi:hypothetical protein
MLKLFLEALLVGLYSTILFKILFYFIQNKYILLYVLGFVKHYISYYLYIHDLYCNNGTACKKILHKNTSYVAKKDNLIIESILEGFWFLIIGSFATSFINKSKWLTAIFTIGFVTHVLSEIIYVHDYFCSFNCKIKK